MMTFFKNHYVIMFFVILLKLTVLANEVEKEFFPIITQFSPVPSGEGWHDKDVEPTKQEIRDTIDQIIDHGFTVLQAPVSLKSKELSAYVLEYAQQKGMYITFHTRAMELFGRKEPPATCVYSDEYPKAVRENAQKQLARVENIKNLHSVFCYQDEPFHWGPQSFGYNKEVKEEFKKRYGYELPADLESARKDPKVWLDVINFRSDYFPDGWRQVYKIIKDINPDFKTVLTHDSHNTFGAGYGSNAEIAIDDVYHWGGDFSEYYIFDIYPYKTRDYRFGQPSVIPRPRISQAHFAFGQMRNLTTSYDKELGFWFGTSSDRWCKEWVSPTLIAKSWTEREMATTAVAQGANFLISFRWIPHDAEHWQQTGEGIRLIQRCGKSLLKAPKQKAKACFLFPRTQYIQLQEEYWNVGLSYELILRSFGELDVIHEEQIVDSHLNGYDILFLCDVKLLPEEKAQNLVSFVENGGVIIADCVPNMGKYKEPMDILNKLFGINSMVTDRLKRTGHYVNAYLVKPFWEFGHTDEYLQKYLVADVNSSIFGNSLEMPIISYRPITLSEADTLLKTVKGQPLVTCKSYGKGKVYLIGFSLQDTYFETWKDRNTQVRASLRTLIRSLTDDAQIKAHVYSSNPDIEASLRANKKEGFVFLINHECLEPETEMLLTDLPFKLNEITDLATSKKVQYSMEDGYVSIQTKVDLGKTKIFKLN